MHKTSLGYHTGWANLAAAILLSGKRCHDETFLKSEWAEQLMELCRLDDDMYAQRNFEPVFGPRKRRKRNGDTKS